MQVIEHVTYDERTYEQVTHYTTPTNTIPATH